MTDCPTCHRAIDGLFCSHCTPKRPPIPPAVKAKIDAILARKRKPCDPEADAERAAIVGE